MGGKKIKKNMVGLKCSSACQFAIFETANSLTMRPTKQPEYKEINKNVKIEACLSLESVYRGR